MAHPKRLPTKAGQESVWDYPRPPKLEPVNNTLLVEFAGQVLAKTTKGYRVLETSHPPVYYIPEEDVRLDFMSLSSGNATNCEWKGQAQYFDAVVGTKHSEQVAWRYLNPVPAFADIKGYFAFYAGRVDACYVDDELVQAQPGNFYGGWITAKVVGPFKGGPGSWGW